MATAAVEAPQIVVTAPENDENVSTTPVVKDLPTISTSSSHPEAAEILRQIEFYFSDENLCQDPHLLGLIKEGKGTASLNEVLGFRKMRRFKPRSAVREVIKQSVFVQISEDNKRISRRFAPSKPMYVKPRISRDRQKWVVPEDKPWLTKGMMKPTGFEPDAADGPVKPEDYNKDREDYDEEIAFHVRIETAITRFCARRKMHQQTRHIFDHFMNFGGMSSGQRAFVGGVDQNAMEDFTKKELAEMTSYYGVNDWVRDGLEEDDRAPEDVTWYVDFEAVAKAFFSSQFITFFNWYGEAQVRTATNVLRNFYNYLLLHDVCSEYRDQTMAARKVCDVADEELPKLRQADSRLPGGFNSACSTLFEGNYKGLHASGADWVNAQDDLGWSDEDAKKVFLAGVFAYGTEEQLSKVEAAGANLTGFKVVAEEELGLEVTRIEFADENAKAIYNDPKFTSTYVKPMGKLICKRWKVPNAPPMDLPKHIVAANAKKDKTEESTFLLEDETLAYCYPGLKMEVAVKELDIGIKWIDYLERTYASFFTWLENERIKEWKEPGPPKDWMRRTRGGEENQEMALEKAEGDDEALD